MPDIDWNGRILWLLNHHLEVRRYLDEEYPSSPAFVEIRTKTNSATSQTEAFALKRSKLSGLINALDKAVSTLSDKPPHFHRVIVKALWYEGQRPAHVWTTLGMNRSTFYLRRQAAIDRVVDALKDSDEWAAFFKEYRRLTNDEQIMQIDGIAA
jgi:hypothetical protein